MAQQRSFGRRAVPEPAPANPPPRRETIARSEPVAAPSERAPQLPALEIPPPDLDLDAEDEPRVFHMPWRQISLTAGLSFTIASFVLPDSVNDAANWLLYALAAASFYASWRGPKRTKKPSPGTA